MKIELLIKLKIGINIFFKKTEMSKSSLKNLIIDMSKSYIIQVSKYDFEHTPVLIGNIDKIFSSKTAAREYIHEHIKIDNEKFNSTEKRCFTQSGKKHGYFLDIIDYKNQVPNLCALEENTSIYEPKIIEEQQDYYLSACSSNSEEQIEFLRLTQVSPSITPECGTHITEKFRTNNMRLLISYSGYCIDKNFIYQTMVSRLNNMKMLIICHERDHLYNYTHVELIFHTSFVTKKKNIFDFKLTIDGDEKEFKAAIFKQTQKQCNNMLTKFKSFEHHYFVQEFAMSQEILEKKNASKNKSSSKSSGGTTSSSESPLNLYNNTSFNPIISYNNTFTNHYNPSDLIRPSFSIPVASAITFSNKPSSYDPIQAHKDSLDARSKSTQQNVPDKLVKSEILPKSNTTKNNSETNNDFKFTIPTPEDVANSYKIFKEKESLFEKQYGNKESNKDEKESVKENKSEVDNSVKNQIIKPNIIVDDIKLVYDWQKELVKELQGTSNDTVLYYYPTNTDISTIDLFSHYLKIASYMNSNYKSLVLIDLNNKDMIINRIVDSYKSNEWNGKVIFFLLNEFNSDPQQYKNIVISLEFILVLLKNKFITIPGTATTINLQTIPHIVIFSTSQPQKKTTNMYTYREIDKI